MHFSMTEETEKNKMTIMKKIKVTIGNLHVLKKKV